LKEDDLLFDLVGSPDCIFDISFHYPVFFTVEVQLALYFLEIEDLLVGFCFYWFQAFKGNPGE
jgi:hypothetical protein